MIDMKHLTRHYVIGDKELGVHVIVISGMQDIIWYSSRIRRRQQAINVRSDIAEHEHTLYLLLPHSPVSVIKFVLHLSHSTMFFFKTSNRGYCHQSGGSPRGIASCA